MKRSSCQTLFLRAKESKFASIHLVTHLDVKLFYFHAPPSQIKLVLYENLLTSWCNELNVLTYALPPRKPSYTTRSMMIMMWGRKFVRESKINTAQLRICRNDNTGINFWLIGNVFDEDRETKTPI